MVKDNTPKDTTVSEQKSNELPFYMPFPAKITHNLVNNLADSNKPEIKQIKQDLIDVKDALTNVDTYGVKEKASELKDGAAKFADEHKDEVKEKVKEGAQVAKEEVKETNTTNVGEKIKDALLGVKEAVLDFVHKNQDDVDEVKKEAQDVKEEVQKLDTKDVKKTVGKLVDDVVAVAKKNDPSVIQDELKDAVNRTGEGRFLEKVSNFFGIKKEGEKDQKDKKQKDNKQPAKKQQKKEQKPAKKEAKKEEKKPQEEHKITHPFEVKEEKEKQEQRERSAAGQKKRQGKKKEEDIDEVLAEIKQLDKKRAARAAKKSSK